jgi:hypothetical protein
MELSTLQIDFTLEFDLYWEKRPERKRSQRQLIDNKALEALSLLTTYTIKVIG